MFAAGILNFLAFLGKPIAKLQLGKKGYEIYSKTHAGKNGQLETINFLLILLSLIAILGLSVNYGSETPAIGIIAFVAAVGVFALVGVVWRNSLNKTSPEDVLKNRVTQVCYQRFVEGSGGVDKFKKLFPGDIQQAVDYVKFVSLKFAVSDLRLVDDDAIHRYLELCEAIFFNDKRSISVLVPDKTTADEIVEYCKKMTESTDAPSPDDSGAE